MQNNGVSKHLDHGSASVQITAMFFIVVFKSEDQSQWLKMMLFLNHPLLKGPRGLGIGEMTSKPRTSQGIEHPEMDTEVSLPDFQLLPCL